jgi:hypothetical protein
MRKLHPNALRIVHVFYCSDDPAVLCGVTSSRTARMLRPGEKLGRDERLCGRCEIQLRQIVAGNHRAPLNALRAAERRGNQRHVLPELEEYCREFAPEEIGASGFALAVAVTDARRRVSGPWAVQTFAARGYMVGVWLARIKNGQREERTAVRGAFAAWLAAVEKDGGERLSEMLSRLSFWVTVTALPTEDEGERLARRALECARTSTERAMALTRIGHALLFDCERQGEAESTLAKAMLCVPDGPVRWEAQYQHAYLAHLRKKKPLAVERYLALFRRMVKVPGAIETDLGYCVATDLLGLMRAANDRDLELVQRMYSVAKKRDALARASTSSRKV